MRSQIVQRGEVVLESSGDDVQANLTAVQITQAADDLGDGKGVHVGGLDSHQGRQGGSVLNHQLGDQPGIDDAVIGVDQHSLASGFVTPARYGGHAPDIFGRAGTV